MTSHKDAEVQSVKTEKLMLPNLKRTTKSLLNHKKQSVSFPMFPMNFNCTTPFEAPTSLMFFFSSPISFFTPQSTYGSMT